MKKRQDGLLFISLLLLAFVTVASLNIDLSSINQLASAKAPTKGVLVILADYANVTHDANSDTPTTIKAKLDEVNSFYNTNSYGTWTNLTYDITPWVQTTDWLQRAASTDEQQNVDKNFMVQAKTLATKLGYNPSNYKYVFVVSSKQNLSSGYGGFQVSGSGAQDEDPLTPSNSSTLFIDGVETWSAYAHELGHALGLGHFGKITCVGTSGYTTGLAGCTGQVYGRTVMGNGSQDLSGLQRLKLKYLTTSNIQNITQSGTYTLSAVDTEKRAASSLKMLKVNNLYIEYRAADINILGDTWVTGEGALLGNVPLLSPIETAGDVDSEQFDLPGTKTDGGINDGESFYDQADNVTITQVSHSAAADTAQIKIDFGAPKFSLGGTLFTPQANKSSSGLCLVNNTPTTAVISAQSLPAGTFTYDTTLVVDNVAKNTMTAKAMPYTQTGTETSTGGTVSLSGITTKPLSLGIGTHDVYAQVIMHGAKGVLLGTYLTNHQTITIVSVPSYTPYCPASPTSPSYKCDIFNTKNGCVQIPLQTYCSEYRTANAGQNAPGC